MKAIKSFIKYHWTNAWAYYAFGAGTSIVALIAIPYDQTRWWLTAIGMLLVIIITGDFLEWKKRP